MSSNPLEELGEDKQEALVELAQARVDGSMSRRQLLRAGGVSALGLLGLSGSASASRTSSAANTATPFDDGDGSIGTADNRIDAYLDAADANSLSAGNSRIKTSEIPDSNIPSQIPTVIGSPTGAVPQSLALMASRDHTEIDAQDDYDGRYPGLGWWTRSGDQMAKFVGDIADDSVTSGAHVSLYTRDSAVGEGDAVATRKRLDVGYGSATEYARWANINDHTVTNNAGEAYYFAKAPGGNSPAGFSMYTPAGSTYLRQRADGVVDLFHEVSGNTMAQFSGADGTGEWNFTGNKLSGISEARVTSDSGDSYYFSETTASNSRTGISMYTPAGSSYIRQESSGTVDFYHDVSGNTMAQFFESGSTGEWAFNGNKLSGLRELPAQPSSSDLSEREWSFTQDVDGAGTPAWVFKDSTGSAHYWTPDGTL